MTSRDNMVLQPRYVVNQVTAGDYDCPRKVLKFLTDLHAAFRMLNLRNDFLRKKFDGRIIVFMLFHSSFIISQKEYLWNFCFILFLLLWSISALSLCFPSPLLKDKPKKLALHVWGFYALRLFHLAHVGRCMIRDRNEI